MVSLIVKVTIKVIYKEISNKKYTKQMIINTLTIINVKGHKWMRIRKQGLKDKDRLHNTLNMLIL